MLTLRFCTCDSDAFKKFIAVITSLYIGARSHNYGLPSLPLALYRASLSSMQRSDLCRGRQDHTRVSPLGRRFPRCSQTINLLLPSSRGAVELTL